MLCSRLVTAEDKGVMTAYPDLQVVDFGPSGPLRCQRCKAYVNPFMTFVNSGREVSCNFCGHNSAVAEDYFCRLGPDGRRSDVYERPELCCGSVEFAASAEYMVRQKALRQPVRSARKHTTWV